MIDELREQVIKYLEDAHALEQHVARQLDAMIETTEDAEIAGRLRHHRKQTERHEQLLRERLEAYDESPSPLKEAGSIFAAMSKGVIDKVRPENAAKQARDGYVAEQLEIASYELLERVAAHAGDWGTAEVARRNRADEQWMAGTIASSWDRVVELSLRAEGVHA